MEMTIIQELDEYRGNKLFIKRDDLIPFSFGGNKARKAKLFFKEIDSGNYNCVVTYGSSSSNHCRVVSNACKQRGLSCYIISPLEVQKTTFNSLLMQVFGAKIITVPVNEVHKTIEDTIIQLKKNNEKPYFIEGGGHGNIGTEAYVQCYQEIKQYEKENNIFFDYIFLASGTGTTQAGLVCGQLINQDKRKIVGISIARKNPRGRNVIIKSEKDYLQNTVDEESIDMATNFIDDYAEGYGIENPHIVDTIYSVINKFGVPLDTTYTGKAFYGMTEYIKQERIQDKNILFIHTGGTPLFFDVLKETAISKNTN